MAISTEPTGNRTETGFFYRTVTDFCPVGAGVGSMDGKPNGFGSVTGSPGTRTDTRTEPNRTYINYIRPPILYINIT
jgi:hypothetical protein